MNIICLQLVYLVSVLCEKDFSIAGFTQDYINGYSNLVIYASFVPFYFYHPFSLKILTFSDMI